MACGSKGNLLGRDLLNKFDFRIVKEPKVIPVNKIVSPALNEFSHYLSESFKSCVTDKVKIDVPVDAKPVFIKARQIPIRLKLVLKNELDRLVAQGTLTQVYSSDWATPIVTVYKPDGSLRLCADFSCTLNKFVRPVNSTFVTIDEAIASVGNAQIFSKLDLSQAFMQIPIHEDSQKYLVINTCLGLFRFNYLPFGLAASPGIFQEFISRVLANIPGVLVYQDDILVMSLDEESHNETLRAVLNKLFVAGLKLNTNKCKFFTDKVEYLGYVFDRDGVHPSDAKISAIVNAPVPKDLKQLQSFIGLCNFYNRFSLNLQIKWHHFTCCYRKTPLSYGLSYSRMLLKVSRKFLLVT